MSSSEIIVIILAALLLFGGKRLPEILRTIGRITSNIKRAGDELKREIGLDVLNDITKPKKTIARVKKNLLEDIPDFRKSAKNGRSDSEKIKHGDAEQ